MCLRLVNWMVYSSLALTKRTNLANEDQVMTLADFKTAVLKAIDEGHEPTIEAYAEYAAAHVDMSKLTEALCLAVIEADGIAWREILLTCLRSSHGIGNALANIQLHIDAQLQPFAEWKAACIDDDAEHNRMMLADLERELKG